jgi:hypothetical protein
MVAPQKKEVLWILDLVGQKQAYCFQALLSTVHVITQEKVVGLRWVSTVIKQPQKIRVLAMNVT